jgi:hypothetical protein
LKNCLRFWLLYQRNFADLIRFNPHFSRRGVSRKNRKKESFSDGIYNACDLFRFIAMDFDEENVLNAFELANDA